MKLCSLFSGGKDSTFALHWAVLKGFEVECLVTIIPRRKDSWMFQYNNVELTRYQAEVLGLPLLSINSSGEKDVELTDLRKALEMVKSQEATGIVTGALLSDYQRMNINILSSELGLKVYSPLWRKDQERYMRELVEYGFEFIITSATAYGFPFDLVGKVINREDVERILERARKFGFNPAFEGGEAETFVVNAPLFKRKLIVEGKPVKLGEFEWEYQIERIH
ncbi:putative ATP binding protein [Metallosphaera sedula]|uniref:ATP-binding protein n=3 Tax=Metallosphaera TaxID=41980 RepID=A0A088E835_9CREN|nr:MULTISPECIES: diphthine--ammonia ligase [Metallosphaera]ABP96165.1 putative ATP binding protein [Metallosphaera sedula DSM 5348]AIM28148.1 putative ATP binding protein [Metallosphaera sedula]AKV74971.1 ATP-binding protein [Metallosphaera sedula]AKV77209.1 ATP-binding protein [Metallosphaera sedula]AKV79459.1 ATP-binding protein [Metallosphaera sedula]